MLVEKNIVFSFLIGCVLLPKYSKQQLPTDCKPCVDGQYWVQHFYSTGSGDCVACPPLLDTCSHQGVDKQCCFDSCGKPKKTSSTNPPKPEITSTTPELTSTPKLPRPKSVMTWTTKPPSTSNDYKTPEKILSTKGVFSSEVEKSPENKNSLNWGLLIPLTVLCVLVSALVFIALLKLYLRVRRRNLAENPQDQAGKTGEEERIALQTLAVQVTDQDSSTRVGGIQDTEQSNFTSALNLSEIHS